jgi:hypothetical protein
VIIRGTVFHHKTFEFKNGETGNKLLILLNSQEGNDPLLLAKTTSQEKNKPKTPGCIKKRSLFFMPKGTKPFLLDTWVQLYEIYPFSPEDFKADPGFKILGSIDSKLMEKIIDCLFIAEGDDIPAIYEGLLRPPLEKSLRLLEEKFRKK